MFYFGSNTLNLLITEAAHMAFDRDVFFPEDM
jgi:hypothetical protein